MKQSNEMQLRCVAVKVTMVVCLTVLGIRDPDKLSCSVINDVLCLQNVLGKPRVHMNKEPDQHFETVSLFIYPGSVTTNIPDFPSRPDEIITTSVRTLFPAAHRWVEPRPNPYYSAWYPGTTTTQDEMSFELSQTLQVLNGRLRTDPKDVSKI
ncbi:uncharacterized protein B0T23DRAFT_144702 [Neurospora hispaniola]|uniref:Uncharacterized protein n=1 Tax=Neurospora hispaniola TaxID=588809 RepID=A0AAJ0MRK2_9PEZI|nr:hypothetical protein B0T23DRAFT_144702 [Neurospora hispaniola]